jgi:glycosyltransferase involved in cell wall biosynthesis
MSGVVKVLIPSNDFDAVSNLAWGYQELGFDVAGGLINFELQSAGYDIVHLLWPEEFCGWSLPTETQVDAILRRLDDWARRSRLIISVNNLYPHRYPKNPLFHRLFTGFYERAEVIHHVSHISKELVCREYPSIADRNHVVRVGFNYDYRLRLAGRDRERARARLGFRQDEIVFLALGDLRLWEEVQLLQSAFDRARVTKKRLLLAARYVGGDTVWRRRWQRWKWEHWQRARDVRSLTGWIPDEELPGLLDAADAVVVIRKNTLNSGVPSLAMTFGRLVIAPKVGSMPELLAGTDNALYDPTSHEDLAHAMEYASAVDRESIGRRNAEIAAGWGWKDIIQACLDALPPPDPRAVLVEGKATREAAGAPLCEAQGSV